MKLNEMHTRGLTREQKAEVTRWIKELDEQIEKDFVTGQDEQSITVFPRESIHASVLNELKRVYEEAGGEFEYKDAQGDRVAWIKLRNKAK